MKKTLLLCATALVLRAQTLEFEVASIQPNQSGPGLSSIRGSAGRIVMENVPLKKLTLWAYGIPDDRDSALIGPDWLSPSRFDIQATFPAGTSPEQVRQMAQKLLADRFHLVLHRESRERPVLALIVDRNGPRLHRAEEGSPRTSGRPGHLEATRLAMSKLADQLSRITGEPVTDATGLSGVFDFTLEWSPDDSAAESSGPSLFSALPEQLGLKLERRKASVDVLVIDHLEKTPTAN